ncbi:MAG: ThuA domain-containing protein [Pirellulales bacterium]|nr:ThuA domain-containing protein [Pirellulales bacterium]
MKRREMLAATGAAVLGLSTFPFGWAAAAENKKQKVLYFTRSAGFEHGAVKRNGDELSFSEKTLIEMGKKAGFEVECTKDGTVFDGDLDQYDCIAFYTSGDLTQPKEGQGPPMSPEGKKKLLDAIAAGKGFVGIHAATDSFQSGGIDPYIAMLGGEFVSHGPQQQATVTVTSPKFPGVGKEKSLTMHEEWYALEKFAENLHVILVQETEGMQGGCYQRPPFPATWARMHDKGRVFYTSFGHRDDIWTNPAVQSIMLGGFAWTMGNVDADVTPNIAQVTPKANQLKN